MRPIAQADNPDTLARWVGQDCAWQWKAHPSGTWKRVRLRICFCVRQLAEWPSVGVLIAELRSGLRGPCCSRLTPTP